MHKEDIKTIAIIFLTVLLIVANLIWAGVSLSVDEDRDYFCDYSNKAIALINSQSDLLEIYADDLGKSYDPIEMEEFDC